MSEAVVTVVHGRHAHLRAQREFLARCDPAPSMHVVVAVDDPGVRAVLGDHLGPATRLVELQTTSAGLPVAAARNAGARAALDAGAGVLVFLDVDCIPSATLIGDYRAALVGRPDGIVGGPVTYLPPTPEEGWTDSKLVAHRNPHGARPDPPAGTFAPIGPALFWSLSFALTTATWQRLPGFYEGYVGYGGEDTDFGHVAVEHGVRIDFYGGADAYHQSHPVSDPPVEHLDDIVRNAAVFAARHGFLPMVGWLGAFRDAGLVEAVDGLPRRTDALRLLTVPARHPYLDAVVPASIERVHTARVQAWEPDPLLEPERFDEVADDLDVVHVHFSFEHLSCAALRAWLDRVEAHRIPLVLTVHDLRNPHAARPQQHTAHLRMLADRAARVITLTEAAADECRRLLGRDVEVMPHPTLLADDRLPAVAKQPVVLVPLKALRANVVEPAELAAAVANGAHRAGMTTLVLLDPATRGRPGFAEILALADRPDVDIRLVPHLPHSEIVELVAQSRAVVLPYRFGTHSGWIELARDLGTTVVAPDGGHYVAQWPAVVGFGNNERTGLDAASLADAVERACLAPPPAPADRTARLAERDLTRARHDALYRELTGK